MFKHVLFDLDGTLTDSKEGIIKSVEYALLKLGESTEGRLDQHIVVGPPMMTTFTQVYGFSEEKARRLYDTFQERYGTKGRFENHPFPGILALLDQLKEAGIKSYVATSKLYMPGPYVRNSGSASGWNSSPAVPLEATKQKLMSSSRFSIQSDHRQKARLSW